MAPVIPLHCLTPGCTAEIVQLLGCSLQTQRLRELGLCEGARFGLLSSGCPCIVQVGGQQLCLRMNAGCQIMVQATTNNAAETNRIAGHVPEFVAEPVAS